MIPFVDPTVGVVVFTAASILKDAVNRFGDLLDDGKPNQSFKGRANTKRKRPGWLALSGVFCLLD